jgi:hypothetical protein
MSESFAANRPLTALTTAQMQASLSAEALGRFVDKPLDDRAIGDVKGERATPATR